MGNSSSQLVQEHEHLSDRVIDTFNTIDANKSGTLSVAEITACFNHSNLAGDQAAIEAHRWFYALNTNKDAKINLDEYKAYFVRKLEDEGVEQTMTMLHLIEGLIPKVIRSKEYVRLSSLSSQEENRSAKVEAALAALTEAQEKMKEETRAEISFLGSVNQAAESLDRAHHELKEESKIEEVDATVHQALNSLAEAKEKLKEEAKLEAAVETALTDAVNALDEARAEMKGEAKLDQHLESATLRAVDEASIAIAATKHKVADEVRMEDEIETALEATKKVISEARHGGSEAKMDSAISHALQATNKALMDAKHERESGSFTEHRIGEAAHLISQASLNDD